GGDRQRNPRPRGLRYAEGSARGLLHHVLGHYREAQRHLAYWTLQPMAALLAEEATNKLGQPVEIDTLRPLQAFDVSGRARALATIVQALAQAKEGGLSPSELNDALTLVNWGANDGAV
ncbi:hypothetical protein SAMN06265378_1131, partial [Paracoccus sediminis]